MNGKVIYYVYEVRYIRLYEVCIIAKSAHGWYVQQNLVLHISLGIDKIW